MKAKIKFLFLMLFVIATLTNQNYAQKLEKTCTSFVLTEEGDDNLIQRLVNAGCTNLYDALKYLRNNMDGSAPSTLTEKMDALIDTLTRNRGGEVFTASLTDFTGGNSPVGINSDGTFIRADFSVYDYEGHTGYLRYTAAELFTYAASSDYYIYMGSSISDLEGGATLETNYKAFAVAWSQEQTATLSVSANTLNVAAANGSTASFNVTSNISWTATSSQSWLTANPANGSGNGTVTVTATANPLATARTATVTVSGSGVTSQIVTINQAAGAGSETDCASFVLTNEGDDRMIDRLEAAGCTNLYQALVYLRNHISSGAPVRLSNQMDALITELNKQVGGEVFTSTLHSFTGEGNSPVGINADGTFIRNDFSVYSYDGHPGYSRYTGDVLFTYSDSPDNDILLGTDEVDLGGGITKTVNYQAFAIAWNNAVCEIVGGAQYETLDAAIAAVPANSPTIIRLLQAIDRTTTLSIKGSKKITLDLNSFQLNINTTTGAALDVEENASFFTTGSGALNASGFLYGVYACKNSLVNITANVAATGGYSESYGSPIGVYAFGVSGDSVAVTINGDVSGYKGIYSLSGAEVRVNGNVTAVSAAANCKFGSYLSISGDATSTGSCSACIEVVSSTADIGGNITSLSYDSNGIYVGSSATVTVGGNISSVLHGITAQSGNINVVGNVVSTSSGYTVGADGNSHVEIGGDVIGAGDCGVDATSSKVTVTGKIQSFYTGIRVSQSGEVFAKGDVIADGTVGVGVNAFSLGKATIDGAIRAHKKMEFGESDGAAVTPTTKEGYLTYSDGAGSYIWIKEPPTTFVISNEYGSNLEGGLIDWLIGEGYGEKNLYEVMQILKPNSGGVITDEFMASLAACPAGSEIFTAKLNHFAGLNGPVCINNDGTFGIQPIFGYDYYQIEGYVTYESIAIGDGNEIFTNATSPDYYIDAGEKPGGTRYTAFGIAWSLRSIEVSVDSIGIVETTTFDITTVASWTAASDQTWLTVKPTSGTGNATVTLTAKTNTAPNKRTAHVTISISGVAVHTITVTQPGSTTGVEVDKTKPKKFELMQNYPNPFNPTTTISWQLSAESKTQIKIYNVLGKEVATLVDEYLPAGNYAREWNISDLPSGIYFYRMFAISETSSFNSTKKMILLR